MSYETESVPVAPTIPVAMEADQVPVDNRGALAGVALGVTGVASLNQAADIISESYNFNPTVSISALVTGAVTAFACGFPKGEVSRHMLKPLDAIARSIDAWSQQSASGPHPVVDDYLFAYTAARFASVSDDWQLELAGAYLLSQPNKYVFEPGFSPPPPSPKGPIEYTIADKTISVDDRVQQARDRLAYVRAEAPETAETVYMQEVEALYAEADRYM